MTNKNDITKEFLGYKGVISSILTKLGYLPAPDVEDILQETYIRTHQSAIAREIRFPKAYMVKTALRLAKSRLSDPFKAANVEFDEAIHHEAEESLAGANQEQFEPHNQYIKMEEFKLLCDAVNELPSQCRKVFVLKKIYGMSQQEIAQSLSLSESTVEKHVAKGMLYCSRYIKAQTKSENKAETKAETKSETQAKQASVSPLIRGQEQ